MISFEESNNPRTISLEEIGDSSLDSMLDDDPWVNALAEQKIQLKKETIESLLTELKVVTDKLLDKSPNDTNLLTIYIGINFLNDIVSGKLNPPPDGPIDAHITKTFGSFGKLYRTYFGLPTNK